MQTFRTSVFKKQAKVVISFDEHEEDENEMYTNMEESSHKISKLTKKKQNIGKGEMKGGQSSSSPLDFIKDQYKDASTIEEQVIISIPT